MPISNNSLNSTFVEWSTRTNQVIDTLNLITDTYANLQGAMTIHNASLLNSGVSLNVANGVLRVSGNNFSSNLINFISNSASLSITYTGRLGQTVYLNLNASTSNSDTSTSNVASANLANSIHQQSIENRTLVTTANTIAVSAVSSAANSMNVAVEAFAKANAALANTSGITTAGSLNVSGTLTLFGNVSVSGSNIIIDLL